MINEYVKMHKMQTISLAPVGKFVYRTRIWLVCDRSVDYNTAK